jgi:hypothetical protein
MRCGGRHSLEITVAIAVAALVSLFLLRALVQTSEGVEEEIVASEVAAIRVELLDRLVHRETVGGALPATGNPLRWGGRVPAGYIGEVDAAPDAAGLWYFDRARDELVYRFRSGREARFRLVRGGAAPGTPASLAGVALQRIDVAPERK